MGVSDRVREACHSIRGCLPSILNAIDGNVADRAVLSDEGTGNGRHIPFINAVMIYCGSDGLPGIAERFVTMVTAQNGRLSKRVAFLAIPVMLIMGAPAVAQSTLADPVPVGTPAGSSIAGTATVNGAIRPAGNPSHAELARRRAHGDQLSACNTRARNSYAAGSDGRKAARERCRTTFQAQKATWYDPRYQRK